ncbi:hypothetical protein BG004_007934 [Podila humilis]|nr:hypothetical protein BG004_007934 [Podila humilis]
MARTARFAAAGCVLFAAVLLANYDPQQHMIDKSKVIGNDDDPALQHSYIRDLTALPERDYPPDEKYLLMDFSPWLGFNNMRYMLERGLYLSQMLNRTFVIPTHLRIRHCTEESVCGVTSTPLDLDAIGHNPQGSRLSLDLGYFIDLNLLARETNGRVINFRTFMEKIIKVPLGKEATLVDSRYGEQVAFWQRVMREHTDAGELDMSLISFSAPEDPDDNDDDDHDEEEQEVDGDIYNNNDRKQGDNVQHANNLNRQQQNSLFHSPRTEISLKRINRAKWDLPEDPTKSFVDNLIRNVLVDDLEFPDPTSSSSSSTNSHDNDDNDNDGPFTTRKTFYAFGDTLKQEDIPWEARFPAFATCKIENYVGLKQVLGREDEVQVLSIEGQFHTAGWIPLAYKDRENALAYRAKAMKQLKYTPAVHEAAEYLLEKLRRQMMMDVAGGINGIGLGIGVGVGRSRDSQRPLSETSSLDEEQQVEEEATDESLPETLAYFRGLGAVLFEDLVDDEFKERFKYLIVYEDWIGLVEQVICARARKFFGTMTSSFTSGIVNMRMSESGESAGSQGAEHAGEPLLFDNFEYLIRAGGPLYPKP